MTDCQSAIVRYIHVAVNPRVLPGTMGGRVVLAAAMVAVLCAVASAVPLNVTQGMLTPPFGVADFGESVAVAANGTSGWIVAVGAPSGSGSVRLYACSSSTTCTLGVTLSKSSSVGNSAFGRSVALSDVIDGVVHVAVGIPGESEVRAYECSSAFSCEEPRSVNPTNITRADGFGNSLSITGGLLVIGAPYTRLNGQSTGAAYVCNITEPTLLLHMLPTPTPALNDRTGYSVSAWGDLVVVGAFMRKSTEGVIGSALIFNCPSAAACAFGMEIKPSNALDSNAYYGWSVSASNGLVTVGAFAGSTNSSGAVYVYSCPTPTSCDVANALRLTSNDPIDAGSFGETVAITETGRLFVGERRWATSYVSNQGAVEVFTCAGASCTYQSRMVSREPRAYEVLGSSLGAYRSFLVAGAMGRAVGGAAYAASCFGASCEACSMGCASPCSETTGECATCRPRWTGSSCSECGAGWVLTELEDDCDCPAGFYGPSCAACPGVDCGAHGTCNDGTAGDGLCKCVRGFDGDDCEDCAAGFYGEGCALCPDNGCHLHGSCVDGRSGNGTCACNAGWGGEACLECLPGHYGPSCLPCDERCEHGCFEGLAGNGTCMCTESCYELGYCSPTATCSCKSGYYLDENDECIVASVSPAALGILITVIVVFVVAVVAIGGWMWYHRRHNQGSVKSSASYAHMQEGEAGPAISMVSLGNDEELRESE